MTTATLDITPATKSDLADVGSALESHFDSRLDLVNARLDEVNGRLSSLEKGQQVLKDGQMDLKDGQQEILRKLEALNAT